MAEFEEQLNAILGDQAAMSQIMALAQSLQKGPDQSQAPAAGAGTRPPTPQKATPTKKENQRE